MGNGIIVCGLNGTGKSTLGKRLADKLGFYFIDSEDLFFSKNMENNYSNQRSYDEAIDLLKKEIKIHPQFVLATVKGDYGNDILPFYQCAIYIKVPKKIRLNRVKARSFQKFGHRMLPGGDMYTCEKNFFDMVTSREDDYVEKWVQSLNCQVICIDGTLTIEENIQLIIKRMQQ